MIHCVSSCAHGSTPIEPCWAQLKPGWLGSCCILTCAWHGLSTVQSLADRVEHSPNRVGSVRWRLAAYPFAIPILWQLLLGSVLPRSKLDSLMQNTVSRLLCRAAFASSSPPSTTASSLVLRLALCLTRAVGARYLLIFFTYSVCCAIKLGFCMFLCWILQLPMEAFFVLNLDSGHESTNFVYLGFSILFYPFSMLI